MSFEGLQVGRYRLLRLLGSGGMGEVYLGEDVGVDRQVAIKVFKSDDMLDTGSVPVETTRRLFERELRAVATLQHPYILPLFDYGDVRVGEGTLSYMVMPYCREGSLEGYLHKQGDLRLASLQQIVHVLDEAADALQYAHEKQIIHQDVKLSNFLIHRWRAPGLPDLLLADFGIAKWLSTQSRTSQAIRGTPTAMAPEQWEGHPVPATDQYALAIMAYELLIGHPPFQGGPGQVMFQHLSVQPQPPSALRSALSPQIDAVILRALQKKPQDRFATVRAFAQAFQQAVLSSPDELENATRKSDPEENLPTLIVRGHEPSVPLRPDQQATQQALSPQVTPASQETTVPPSSQAGDTLSKDVTPIVASSTPPVAPPHTPQKRGGTLAQRVLIVLLVLCLMAGSAGAAFFLTHPSTSGAVTHTPTPTPTLTPSPKGADNPYPPNTGTLALNDPLSDNSRGYGWEEGTRDQGNCAFVGDAYQANISLTGYFHSCLALSTNFSNFAYEVQMTLGSASAGGLVIRADRATTHFYYFTVDREGGYLLKTYYDNAGDATTVASGSGITFSETEIIGIVAQGNTFSMYVNRKLIGQVQDAAFTQGQVGVVTYEGSGMFRNAKLWTL